MENLVEIKDVSFSYGFRPVLKGISMTVPRGKVVSIMGLSGCGKTTLLRLIAGALRPRKGEVTVAGRLMNRIDRAGLYALRRNVVLPQPESPMMLTTLPRGTVMLIPFSTGRNP